MSEHLFSVKRPDWSFWFALIEKALVAMFATSPIEWDAHGLEKDS